MVERLKGRRHTWTRRVKAVTALGVIGLNGGCSADTAVAPHNSEIRPASSNIQTVSKINTGGVDLESGKVALRKHTVQLDDTVTKTAVENIHAAGEKSTKARMNTVTAVITNFSELPDANALTPGKEISIPEATTIKKLVHAVDEEGSKQLVTEVRQLIKAVTKSDNDFNNPIVRRAAEDVIQELALENVQRAELPIQSTKDLPTEAQSPNINTVPQVSRGGIIQSPEQRTDISIQDMPNTNETNDSDSPWVPLVPLGAGLLAAGAVVRIGYNSLKKKYSPDPEKKSTKKKFLTWLRKAQQVPQQTAEELDAWQWEDGILAKLKASPYRPYKNDKSCYSEYFTNSTDVERILARMHGQLDKDSASNLEAFKENIFNKDNLVLVVYLEEPKWGYKLIPHIDVIEIPNEESRIATGEIPAVTGALTVRTFYPGLGKDTQEKPLVRV